MDLLMKKFIKKRKHDRGLSSQNQLLLLKRLHRLLSKGYSLSDSFNILSWDQQMTAVVRIIRETIEAGESLDIGLKRAKFHPMIVTFIYFSRINGDLISSLANSIDSFENRLSTIARFKQVSRYPLILLTIFISLLLLIKRYILPAYLDMFHLYTETSFSITFSLSLFHLFYYLVLLVLFLFIFTLISWKYLKEALPLEKQLTLYEGLPLYRRYVTMQTSFYFAIHMSLLFKAGLSLTVVIQHFMKQTELPLIAYYAKIMDEQLKQGRAIQGVIRELPLIDEQLARVFDDYQDNESLEKDLHTYAEFIAEHLEQRIKTWLTYIQPITFGLLGLSIIFVYLSLLWPMFQLIDSI